MATQKNRVHSAAACFAILLAILTATSLSPRLLRPDRARDERPDIGRLDRPPIPPRPTPLLPEPAPPPPAPTRGAGQDFARTPPTTPPSR